MLFRTNRLLICREQHTVSSTLVPEKIKGKIIKIYSEEYLEGLRLKIELLSKNKQLDTSLNTVRRFWDIDLVKELTLKNITIDDLLKLNKANYAKIRALFFRLERADVSTDIFKKEIEEAISKLLMYEALK